MIIASGPSLTYQDVLYTKGKAFTIAINNNWEVAPWSNVLYACDKQWWDWYHQDVIRGGFKGLKITQEEKAADSYPDLIWIYGEKVNTGLSDSVDYIKCGHLGGYQAINLAVNFGATKIILLGFDCKIKGGVSHWFGHHPSRSNHDFKQWAPSFNNLVPDLEERGVKVFNCCEDSAIDAFPIKRVQEVI